MSHNLENLPLLPTTVVGSFPKPKYLLKAMNGFKKGRVNKEELKKAQLKALDDIIAFQEEIGLDVFVDGEVEREEMTIYFAENFKGMVASDWVRSYGNRYYRKPIIKDKIILEKPMTLEFYKEAQKRTDKPVKGMITGPYTMVDWSYDEYYKDRRQAIMDCAREYRKEAEALRDAGCKILQIDEPAASVRLDEWDLFCESIDVITKDLGMYTICHICYGDFDNVPNFSKVPVDNLDLECVNNNFSFLKKDGFSQDISAGVFDVHTHKQTSKDEIVKNIEKLLTIFPKEKIWIDPDCGLRTRTREESLEQLKLMVAAVKEVREKL